MPVIKSAIKKLRQDRKKEVINDQWREKVDAAVKAVKKSHTAKNLDQAFSAIDKATKKNLMHANKAARMKSQISKLVPSTTAKKPTSAKKSASKTSQAA
jgi:small subunit ribosomal protein S20